MVLCGKLLKVLHGISTKHKAFDAQRMMKDISSLTEAV
ncbi:Mobile element protein [Cytobacillus firmus]|uniref:Mobile element protein n=1 Tax=Cytobacillus firmus TaxID=1399 RepID=A0A800N7Y9_CYTFI|nr:Mobile element protein [Cytobacillus firmus]